MAGPALPHGGQGSPVKKCRGGAFQPGRKFDPGMMDDFLPFLCGGKRWINHNDSP